MMIFYSYLLLLLTVHLHTAIAAKTSKRIKQILRFEEFKNCDMKTEEKYENMTINSLGKGRTGLSGTLVMHQDYGMINKVKIDVLKCTLNKDGCEIFFKFNYNNACQLFLSKDQVWSPVLQGFKPPMTCPIKKGTYVFKDAEVTLDDLKSFAHEIPFIERHYWVVKVKFYHGTAVNTCMRLGASLITTREKI